MRGRIVFYSLLLVCMFSFRFCTRQTTYMVKTEVDLASVIHLKIPLRTNFNPFWRCQILRYFSLISFLYFLILFGRRQ